jgi:hypothetical protein
MAVEPVSQQRTTRQVVAFIVVFMWFRIRSSADLFGDLRILHLGGRLMGAGDSSTLYAPDAFLRAASLQPDGWHGTNELAVFIGPPTMAWSLAPLGSLSFPVAAGVWVVFGVVAAAAAVRILGLHPLFVVVAVLSPAGFTNFWLGQTGLFAVLAGSLLLWSVVHDRTVVAGVVLGLSVVKPTLFLGVVLWLAMGWRDRKAIFGWAAATAGSVLAATLVVNVDSWRTFRSASVERLGLEASAFFNQPTVVEFVKRTISPDVPAAVVLALALAAGAVSLRSVQLRSGGDPATMIGLGILISMLVSPHLLVYDTTLMLVPIGLLHQRGLRHERDRLTLFWVASTGACGIIDVLVRDTVGWSIWLLTPAFMGMTVWWVRQMLAAQGQSNEYQLAIASGQLS